MSNSFKARPLFRKRKLPGGFKLRAASARPRRPLKDQPLLPFTAAAEAEARGHFARAKLQEMRSQLEKENP